MKISLDCTVQQGKSTFLYKIRGMDRATKGQISFDGEDISNIDDEKMSSIRFKKM